MAQTAAGAPPLISERATQAALDVKGAAVNYYDSGDSGVGTAARDPVVLLHGTGGTALKHFGYLFPSLEFGQRVVALDFAPKPHSTDLSLDDLVEQAVAVIKRAVGGKPVTLVGYSLGAVVAARVASRHPDIVNNLVLVAGWMTTDGQQRLRNSVWQALYETKRQEIADFTAFTAFSPSFLRSVPPAHMQGLLRGIQPDSFDEAQMRINRDVDISEDVATLSARTLVIGCTRDQMAPVAHSKSLFGAIEDCRY
ncbi:alpha/beta hydrolase, partial [Phenylobacterium sp.]|uniref:alpha/beta fold hydrolase n=1 Tax=Phenylobacterium sp. TaxID=1871053 RepID=UPI0019B7AE04